MTGGGWLSQNPWMRIRELCNPKLMQLGKEIEQKFKTNHILITIETKFPSTRRRRRRRLVPPKAFFLKNFVD